MQCTFDQLQNAFINGSITLEQFVEVLTDNFGQKRTKKILKHNLKKAIRDENKRIRLSR